MRAGGATRPTSTPSCRAGAIPFDSRPAGRDTDRAARSRRIRRCVHDCRNGLAGCPLLLTFAPAADKPAAPYTAAAHVDADKPGHNISEGIYGVCALPREKLIEYGIRVTRWGGNPSTRYNWKLGVDNGAADWYFKNRGAPPRTRPTPAGSRPSSGIRRFGATTYQTVPMIGWVAKDAGSYGFSVAKYDPQKATEPGHPDVGNGVKPDGSYVTGNDPKDTSVEAPPEFIAEGVRLVVKRAGKADGSDGMPGVKYWALDNEPMLWNSTHRDVRPKPLGYDELWERTVQVRRGDQVRRPDGEGGRLL